jgi:hypothetical protein
VTVVMGAGVREVCRARRHWRTRALPGLSLRVVFRGCGYPMRAQVTHDAHPRAPGSVRSDEQAMGREVEALGDEHLPEPVHMETRSSHCTVAPIFLLATPYLMLCLVPELS